MKAWLEIVMEVFFGMFIAGFIVLALLAIGSAIEDKITSRRRND